MFIRVCAILAFAAQAAAAQSASNLFVIDASHPYVYLNFDHVGKRAPLSPNEPHTGLWLRLVNNCRVPIVVTLYNSSPDGLALFDEVLPAGLGTLSPMGQPIMGPDVQPFPRRGQPKSKPPQGYSAEVGSTTTIPSGQSLLFSVPINHVSPYWYMEIRVKLAPPGSEEVTEPDTRLSFHWWDIPEDVRATLSH